MNLCKALLSRVLGISSHHRTTKTLKRESMGNKLPVKRADHSAILSKTKKLSQITSKNIVKEKQIDRQY